MPFSTYLTFNPHQTNRGRKSGFGVWRVAASYNMPTACVRAVLIRSTKELRLLTAKHYRPGTIVNPKRLALDYLRSQQQ